MIANLNIVVLAAGQGKRMHSRLPKVLQPVAGRPMLRHVLDCARQLNPARLVVVYGHGGDQVQAAIGDTDIIWAHQADQLGTGHAVAQALPHCVDGNVLVLYGDCPLITAATLTQLLTAAGDGLGILTATLPDATGYGRIVRGESGDVLRIVEQKDATEAERVIGEFNTGFIAAPTQKLHEWLPRLQNANAQGEYYLTDIVALAVADGTPVATASPLIDGEADGVNDKRQLAQLERVYQRRAADRLMAAGITLIDPARFDLRGHVTHGQDVEIDINVILEGEIRLGHGVKIGPNCYLKNVTLGDNVIIKANTVIEDSVVGAGSDLGPFARVRPESVLGERVHVGNFVELKKARLGNGTKAGHLAYLGDAVIGERVNVSAGVITCNYDGANKFVTTIGDDAFIGTDSQLVAPVTIERGAYIAAGSTITKTAPADALTICRAREQRAIMGWKKPVKQPKSQ
jgi:bifunctional UDP-N-acetylglucosamine pyrophosphorylase/glucosamine-1-phosphate N-acetyltransferase